MRVLLLLVLIAAAMWTAPWQGRAGVDEDRTPIMVASFNVRFGTADDGANAWAARKGLCIEVLRSLNADVIGLQEALDFQLDEIRNRMPGYALIGVGRDDGRRKGEHAAMLVRSDRFAIDRSATVWLSDTPDVPGSKSWGNGITRVVTWARLIDLESGQAVWVYNMHLDHQSQPSRARSAELVCGLIHERPFPDEPVIVMGDCNAGEENPVCRYLRGEAASASGRTDAPASPALIDTFRVIHPDAKQVGTFNGFADQRNGEKIDHIFASRSLQVLDAGIDRTRGSGGACPSDHDAVWARLAPRRDEDRP
ncbi:MAG: endonuclease/exonuclease/phosphatase family protein [Phycisphaerales bacterium]